MSGSLPKIHLRVPNSIFTEVFESHSREKTSDKAWKAMSMDENLVCLKSFAEKWRPKQDKILKGLTDILELGFQENIITVYVMHNYRGGGMGDPVIVMFPLEGEDLFSDVLAHELTHRLLSTNVEEIAPSYINAKMFPDISDFTTKVHVVVDAVMQHIYVDVLGEQWRLDRNVQLKKEKSGYKKSWDIVLERGYRNIIEEYKSYYPEAKGTLKS